MAVKSTVLYFQVILGFITLIAAQSGQYGQCGGIGWTGATTCISGWTCTKQNDYYSQCLPGAATTSVSSSSGGASTPSTPSSSSASVPTPTQTPANISPEWAAAYKKAQATVAKLSTEDKVNLGTGVQWMKGPCVGNIPAISSIPGFSGLCLQDGPVGVRYADKISVFPPEINVAATFNRTLMRQRGAAMGAEFKGKGAHVALGPMMNLMRVPNAGRNWEGGGGDPFLSGELAFETVTGIQSSGAQACAKHYINNEQEHFRDSSSSIVDDRTQHELYLHPFLRSVQANVASVMCSYNQINGSFSCENDKTLNGLLKGELGFQGYVTSDWWATHSGASAVNAGLDMTMPGDETYESGTTYFGQNLINAVNSGQVTQDRITDLATRILAAWYLLGQDSGFPAVNFDSWTPSQGQHIDVSGSHASLIRTIDAASTVLLKNVDGTLPLSKPKTIGIVGNGAGSNSQGPNGFADRGGDSGVLAIGWGSGTADFPYLIAPVDAITTRAKQDGTTVTSSLSDTDLTGAANAASGKDIAFVFITADSGEGYITVEGNAGDRNDLSAWHGGDALVAQVAKSNKNTVVVVNSVGPINTEAWVTHPNVTAIVWSGVPGQEAGNGLVDVLYGSYSPSGRLPFTIGKSTSDYSTQLVTSGSGIVPIPYNEGLFIDYRHFDQANIAPRFEFGFGLSYTTFNYSNLKISGSTAGGTRQPNGPGASLDPWLHDPVVTVTFTLTNTGQVDGTEIPQLYTSPPASAKSAPNNLKGFDSVFLAVGASTTVSFELSRYDFSVWNVVSQQWDIPSGVTGISIGASSRDVRLKGSITN
ncbi:cellulose-binding beta-glucosidase [Irpex rosettiformis]|uniref:Cellulose-binding beta-glucosidase n=1 Tax=Irpex rosettiformis TaxID=378272 RepID=A0ACB8ULX6_9APHY|nr:cellulose-binding beta-glucosidase [Irpex rosettiformis]